MTEAELLKALGAPGGEAPAMGTLSRSTFTTYKVRLGALMKVTGAPLKETLAAAIGRAWAGPSIRSFPPVDARGGPATVAALRQMVA